MTNDGGFSILVLSVAKVATDSLGSLGGGNMRQDRAPRSLRPQAAVTTSRGDKQRHVFCFAEAVFLKDFNIQDYVACDGIAKAGKKGEEVVWGISFLGDTTKLLRVRRALVRNGIRHSLISHGDSPEFREVWRQHSCLHPILRDLQGRNLRSVA